MICFLWMRVGFDPGTVCNASVDILARQTARPSPTPIGVGVSIITYIKAQRPLEFPDTDADAAPDPDADPDNVTSPDDEKCGMDTAEYADKKC